MCPLSGKRGAEPAAGYRKSSAGQPITRLATKEKQIVDDAESPDRSESQPWIPNPQDDDADFEDESDMPEFAKCARPTLRRSEFALSIDFLEGADRKDTSQAFSNHEDRIT